MKKMKKNLKKKLNIGKPIEMKINQMKLEM